MRPAMARDDSTPPWGRSDFRDPGGDFVGAIFRSRLPRTGKSRSLDRCYIRVVLTVGNWLAAVLVLETHDIVLAKVGADLHSIISSTSLPGLDNRCLTPQGI